MSTCNEWTVDEVYEWVRTVDNGKFASHADKFKFEEVQGCHIHLVTREDLKDIFMFTDEQELNDFLSNLREITGPLLADVDPYVIQLCEKVRTNIFCLFYYHFSYDDYSKLIHVNDDLISYLTMIPVSKIKTLKEMWALERDFIQTMGRKFRELNM